MLSQLVCHLIDQFDVSSKYFLFFSKSYNNSMLGKNFHESGLFLQLLIEDTCFRSSIFLPSISFVFIFFSFYKKGGIVKLFFYSFASMCVVMFYNNVCLELSYWTCWLSRNFAFVCLRLSRLFYDPIGIFSASGRRVASVFCVSIGLPLPK